jgi:hypothetical protein
MADSPLLIELAAERRSFELAAEALRGEADRRRRAAVKFSGELEADLLSGRVKDIRTGALQVVKTLAEADALGAIAGQLDAALVDDDDGSPAPSPAAAGDGSEPEPGEPPIPDPSADPDVARAREALGLSSSLDEDDGAAIPEGGLLIAPGGGGEPRVIDPAAIPAGSPTIPAV